MANVMVSVSVSVVGLAAKFTTCNTNKSECGLAARHLVDGSIITLVSRQKGKRRLIECLELGRERKDPSPGGVHR